jgi:hypothetical protein
VLAVHVEQAPRRYVIRHERVSTTRELAKVLPAQAPGSNCCSILDKDENTCFASSLRGNLLTEDEQFHNLNVMLETATRLWGREKG